VNQRLLLGIAAAVVLCGGAVCYGAARIVPALLDLDCEPSSTPSVSPVYTDVTAVARRFPTLPPIQTAHWQTREVRPRTCPDIGPMDYIHEGAVGLPAEAVTGYRGAYAWQPATPEIQPALRPYVPAAAAWTGSPAFDAAIGAGDTRFFLDAASGTLYYVLRTT